MKMMEYEVKMTGTTTTNDRWEVRFNRELFATLQTPALQFDTWPRFSTTVAFEALWFRNGAAHRKTKTNVGSDDERPMSSPNLV